MCKRDLNSSTAEKEGFLGTNLNKKTRLRFLEAAFRVARDLKTAGIAIAICPCLFLCPWIPWTVLTHSAADRAFSPGAAVEWEQVCLPAAHSGERAALLQGHSRGQAAELRASAAGTWQAARDCSELVDPPLPAAGSVESAAGTSPVEALVFPLEVAWRIPAARHLGLHLKVCQDYRALVLQLLPASRDYRVPDLLQRACPAH